MREYTDIGVNPSTENLEPVIAEAAKLGYSKVGVDAYGESDKIDLVHRVDLHPRSQNDLGKHLRRLRRKTEIIVVHCKNRSIFRQAAHDNRIDYVRFPVSGNKKLPYLERRQAGLMRDSGIGFEVCIRDLLDDDRESLAKRLSIIGKSLGIAQKHNLPVVVSSGAEDLYGLRDPFGLASLMSLLGVDEETALDMISTTPNKRIMENRAKLSPDFIEPGVWLIDP